MVLQAGPLDLLDLLVHRWDPWDLCCSHLWHPSVLWDLLALLVQ